MRWVKEVVKLNVDYKFCLGCLVFGDVVLALTTTSIRLPRRKEIHLNSWVYQAYSNHDLGIR
jgi:hypothetical protein